MPADSKTSVLATVPGFYQRTMLKTLLPTSLPLQENYQILTSVTQCLPRASSAGDEARTLSIASLQEISCLRPPQPAPS